ncbi:hypothetical protein BDZ94DRAFT_1371120 [Collybia nuda]|uniref:DNA helicase n=1 Tax=Collybia nuda TaxID=64659 RepID=A0A9P6CGU2_9AGAR|nr:hypothetical protein BDZ94DRAFT_1371120 [Collybia nuda]
MTGIVCSFCGLVFQGLVIKARNARDVHVRKCQPSVAFTVGSTQVTLERRSDGYFYCECGSPSCSRRYGTTTALKTHFKNTNILHKTYTDSIMSQSSSAGEVAEPEVPDEGSQLITHQDLDPIGFGFNQRGRSACPYQSSHDWYSQVQWVTCQYGFVAKVPDEFPDMGLGPMDQVDGLRLHKGFQCEKCNKCYGTIGSITSHHHHQHAKTPVPSSWPPVHIQQLDRGSHKAYFKVIPHPARPEPETSILLQNLRVNTDANTALAGLQSSDPRLISPWLRSTKWHQLIKGKDVGRLRSLVAAVTDSEFPGLVSAIHMLFMGSTEMLDHMPELFLQRLNTPDPTKGLNHTPFHKHQDHEIRMQEYAQPITKLIAMLLRNEGDLEFDLPPKVVVNLHKIRERMVTKNTGDIPYKIFYVLYGLWTASWPRTRTISFPDPTITDGSFAHPKYTTGVLAKMQYDMRMVFIVQVDRSTKIKNDTDYIRQGVSLERWYTENQESTFNSIRSLQHQASAIAYSQQGLPKVWWLDRDTFQVMLYEGHRIEFQLIREMFAVIETELVRLWEEELSMGLKVHVNYGELSDDLTNDDVGYSFVSDPRNGFGTDRDILMRSVLESPRHRRRFLVSLDPVTGVPVWNQTAFREWLFHYSRFHALLIVRAEMLGGSPGRMTELTGMTYRNTPTTTTRNLLAFGRYLAILVTYHKGSAMTGQDKLIPHALDAISSDLIVQDLTVARPFAEMAVYVCYPAEGGMHGLYANQLFVNNGRLFLTMDITNMMKRYTQQAVGYSIGVQAWRHISAAWRRKMCSKMAEILEDDEYETIEALQSSHSRQTENRIYGVSAEILAGAAEDVLPLYLDASTEWQIECRTVPGGLSLPYPEARSFMYDNLVKSGTIPRSRRTVGGSYEKVADLVAMRKIMGNGLGDIGSEKGSGSKHKEDKTLVEEDLFQISSAVVRAPAWALSKGDEEEEYVDLELEVACNVDHNDEEPEWVPKTPSQSQGMMFFSHPRGSASPHMNKLVIEKRLFANESQCLNALRRLSGNPKATWWSNVQQDAIMETLALRTDILVIMATGYGKTMLALIPPLVEDNLVTVVVLLLRSLIMDYIRKLQAIGMGYELYASTATRVLKGTYNLVIVSADSARSVQWKKAIGNLNRIKPVARLVFDEAQLAKTSDDYRESLRNLYELRVFPMQIILLSGTVPPMMESSLLADFGLKKDTIIFRTPTDRPELEYIIYPFEENALTNMMRAVEVYKKQSALFESCDRALIFVPYLATGERMASILGCPFYNGDKKTTEQDQQMYYDQWILGGTKVMCVRYGVTVYNDGQGVYCKADGTGYRCNRCKSGSTKQPVISRPEKRLAPTTGAFDNVAKETKKRKAVHVTANYEYVCHDALHDTFESGANSCTFPDLVAPIGFAVFCNTTVREAAQEQFGKRWIDLRAHEVWLNGAPVAGHKSNLSAVFLWVLCEFVDAWVY